MQTKFHIFHDSETPECLQLFFFFCSFVLLFFVFSFSFANIAVASKVCRRIFCICEMGSVCERVQNCTILQKQHLPFKLGNAFSMAKCLSKDRRHSECKQSYQRQCYTRIHMTESFTLPNALCTPVVLAGSIPAQCGRVYFLVWASILCWYEWSAQKCISGHHIWCWQPATIVVVLRYEWVHFVFIARARARHKMENQMKH